MKKIIILALSSVSVYCFSQVTIGNVSSSATRPSSPSVLLEFGDDGNKGVILPYVETMPTNAVGGTLVFDVSADAEYKVKVKNENTGWTDLSVNSGHNAAIATDVKDPQTSLTEKTDARVIIGKTTTTSPGIVVLEPKGDAKAMVLPIVSSYEDVINPSPGMMVYINKTGSKRLAVFNGQKWSFWKP